MNTEFSIGEDLPNPLDSVEEILSANNWIFNRMNPDELMVEVTGKTGTYRLFFLWQKDMSALQFCCQYDVTVPAKNRDAACRALIHVNERLWMGHFDIPAQTNTPSFRQTCLFRGASKSDNAEHIEDLVDISLTQCERYYPLFHFLAKTPTLDEQNLNLAVMETVGGILMIALIGCGKMGASLLRGWLKNGYKATFLIVEPGKIDKSLKKFKTATFVKRPGKQLMQASVIVMAVKPQNMAEACGAVKPYVGKKTLILSIAAGRSIKSFENIFGQTQPVIRTMPNLPASIGKGMTVAIANKNASAAQRKTADALLRCVGKVEWLKSEDLMDAATALCGNGPAYVFYLAELLAESAHKSGLDKDTASVLARQVIIGGGALAEAEERIPAAQLRKNVTSPGGTTEAALEILINGDMQKLFDRAIEAGKKRSKELSS